MTEGNPIVVIGGGHNGLVCAAYLAKKGRTVVVLEAADEVGGAAVTREFSPGFKVSACAHLLNLLDARITRELALESHGLQMSRSDLSTVALAADGDHLIVSGDGARGASIGAEDQAALLRYRKRMGRFAALLGRLHNQAPPRLGGGGYRDLFKLARLGLDMRRLGRTDMREFMRIAGINIYDVLEENFQHPLLKGALALDAVLGNHLGPRSNNSVLNGLHRMSGSMGGQAGSVCLPRGGMGAVSAALSACASSHGVSIRTACPVARIALDGGRVSGVELASGERIAATTVISNADPKTTYLKLLGARHLDAGFAHRVHHMRARGNAAKLHLALDGPPDFTGLDPALLGARLVVAPDPAYVERAFDHAKYGRYSSEPAMEIVLPTVGDPSLAKQGQHVLSAIVQYAPYQLKAGWDSQRQAFLDLSVDLIARYAPDIRSRIVASELLTPLDIERQFRIAGGHWHHGELVLDTALMLRPIPGHAQYAAPLDGLFLCGAGCHPGGGIMGSAGRNAANAVLAAGT